MSGENFEKILEYLDQTRDGIKKLENSGIVDQLSEENQDKVEDVKKVLDQLKKDGELIDQMKELKKCDWENPTQEMVTSALAVSKDVIERIKTLPFLAENEAVQVITKYLINCLTLLHSAVIHIYHVLYFLPGVTQCCSEIN